MSHVAMSIPCALPYITCICALALAGVFFPYNRGALITACVARPGPAEIV